MKHIKAYNIFERKVNERYDFINIINQNNIKSYKFKNKDGIVFRIVFRKINEYTYEREYYKDINGSDFNLLERPDAYNVLDTVAYITSKFIEDYSPIKIIIDHIYTKGEKQKNVTGNSKRAKANFKFIKRYIPKNYNLELNNNTTYITKS